MVRVGIVGCGGIGMLHAQGYQSSRNCLLAAVCDRDRAKADLRAKELGVRAYDSLGEMLRNEELDALGIITADYEHFEPVLEALEAGKHVLVEKPLALELEEARRLVEKAGEAGVQLAVDYNRRFSRVNQLAHKYLLDGELGDLAYILLKLSQGGPYGHSKDPYYPLYELQVHAFDLLRFFCGDVVQVSCLMGDVRGTGILTSAAVSLRFTSGAVGTLLGSWDSSFNHPIEHMELCGTKAQVITDNGLSGIRLLRHNREDETVWRPSMFHEGTRFFDSIRFHVHAFIAALEAGRPVPVSGLDGLRSLELARACVRSYEEGCAVKPYD